MNIIDLFIISSLCHLIEFFVIICCITINIISSFTRDLVLLKYAHFKTILNSINPNLKRCFIIIFFQFLFSFDSWVKQSPPNHQMQNQIKPFNENHVKLTNQLTDQTKIRYFINEIHSSKFSVPIKFDYSTKLNPLNFC